MMKADIRRLIELIRVPGQSCQEKRISDRIRTMLLETGLPGSCIRSDDAQKRSPYGGQTGNLIVDLPGRRPGPRRLLSTHMDTIASAVGSDPHVEGNRLVNKAKGRSLGADARAGCALLIRVIEELVKGAIDHPPCTFLFFVQEELGLVGSRALDLSALGEPGPVMGFNFDGGDPAEIVNRGIGVSRLYITVRGIAAHAAWPQNGVSAAEIEAKAVAALADRGWHGVISQQEGTGTANLGVLQGGTMSNQVMPELKVLMEARSFVRNFRDRILQEWKTEFRKTVRRYNTGREDMAVGVSFSAGPKYDPFSLDEREPVVLAARRAVTACGLEPLLVADEGGMDTNSLVGAGLPAVGMGMGLHGAHQEDEWLDLEQFHSACRVAAFLCGDRNAS
jgi:tripeptide aminopeptidase